MTQTQLFQIRRQFPGTVDLTAFLVDQMHAAGEILVRLQRHGKRQHQGRGAIQLHLRGVEQRQRFALAFFRQRRQLDAVRFCRRAWVAIRSWRRGRGLRRTAVITPG